MASKEKKRERGRDARPTSDAPESGSTATEWFKSIVIAIVLFLVLRTFLVQTFVITSGSMEETLLVGDMLLVNRAAIGTRIPGTQVRIPGYSSANRFDVLVFDPHHEPDLKLIKRLIGLPGDTLAMRNRVLYLNGDPVDEPYVVHKGGVDVGDPRMAWQRDFLLPGTDPTTYAPTRDNWGPIVVPDEHYFMLGDNREESLDSRYWGPLADWRLEGRAVFIYYSYNKGSYRAFPAIREVRWGRLGQLID
jgi:signal peptidase I